MKKLILFFICTHFVSTSIYSQQWLYFPSGINNNRIDIGNLAIAGDSITLEALITPQNSSPVPIAYDIVSKHFDMTDCNYLFRPTQFAIRTSSGFIALANPKQLCMDSTYHVAGTYDGDSIKYYVNGIAVASQHWTGNLTQNSYNTGIGNRWYTGTGFYEQFIGYIDEVRIWNVARSQNDLVNNMYSLLNPASQYGLQAYYTFDGNNNNVQGNTSWNGTAIGMQLQNTPNPLFTGSVSINTCNPTGIIENDKGPTCKVHPNPGMGNFTITLSEAPNDIITFVLNNTIGTKLHEYKLNNKTTIVNSNLDDGIYFVTISTIKGSFTTKIIIQK